MSALLQARRVHVPGHLPQQPLETLSHHFREQVRPGVRAAAVAHCQQGHQSGRHLEHFAIKDLKSFGLKSVVEFLYLEFFHLSKQHYFHLCFKWPNITVADRSQ